MTPPEPSDPSTARPEHSNAAETQENELKNNFIMKIQALAEEMKNSLEEIEEKTQKKLEENRKFFKQSQEKKNQTGKGNYSRPEN